MLKMNDILWKTTSTKFNVKYLNKDCTDLTQIWNLSLGDQTKVYKTLNDELGWETVCGLCGVRKGIWILILSSLDEPNKNNEVYL